MLEMTLVAASPSSSATRASQSRGALCFWRGAGAAAQTRTTTVLLVLPAQPFQNRQGETLPLSWFSSSLVPLGLSWYLVLCGHSCNTYNNCPWFRALAGQGFLLANEGGRCRGSACSVRIMAVLQRGWSCGFRQSRFGLEDPKEGCCGIYKQVNYTAEKADVLSVDCYDS